MCIRDRYQRRVHGIQRMLKKKKVVKKVAPAKTVSKAPAKPDYVETLFKRFSSTDIIEIENFQNIATELDLDMAKDPEVLIFLYYCDSQSYGEIRKAGFTSGMKKLGVTSEANWKSLKYKLQDVVSGKK
eukprot:TRINITY_DN2769_c0_g1_i2.p1 TRINITY_DN2769_c0_g1~~TRINITY_DN2769_c0_g1_i2.p1  ORF type:complete len:129 (+),score=25.76 TRINITY_DN2769_c0_g1_i2:141-527(+)